MIDKTDCILRRHSTVTSCNTKLFDLSTDLDKFRRNIAHARNSRSNPLCRQVCCTARVAELTQHTELLFFLQMLKDKHKFPHFWCTCRNSHGLSTFTRTHSVNIAIILLANTIVDTFVLCAFLLRIF